MMAEPTPEELAERILVGEDFPDRSQMRVLRKRAAQAIREAVAAERSTCEQVARERVALTPPHSWNRNERNTYRTGCDDMSLSIADAIKARGESSPLQPGE